MGDLVKGGARRVKDAVDALARIHEEMAQLNGQVEDAKAKIDALMKAATACHDVIGEFVAPIPEGDDRSRFALMDRAGPFRRMFRLGDAQVLELRRDGSVAVHDLEEPPWD